MHAGTSETLFIATDNGEVMNQSRRCQESIQDRHRISHTQAAPLICYPLINRQEPIAKLI